MFNLVSLVIGFFALASAMLAFLPLLGWMNWLIVPLAAMGVGFGFLSHKDSGRKLNIFVLCLGIFRLFLGGGIF